MLRQRVKNIPPMKKILPALALLCTMGSCVTLFNGPSTSLNVRIPDNAKVVYTNECGSTDSVAPGINNMARLIVRRSNKKLPLTVVSDTGSYSFAVKPTLSWLFWANVYPLYGLGFLVDYNNPNRFTYPHFVYPDPRRKNRVGYLTKAPLMRSDWELSFTPPLVNGFVFNPARMDLRGSVLGIGGGAIYHHRDNAFWWVEVGAATAGNGGRGAGYRRFDSTNMYTKVNLSGWHINMRHHHSLGRLDVGYGLSSGERKGKEYYATRSGDSLYNRFSHFSAGLSISANYRITNSFYGGVSYQPQLYDISKVNMGFSYSHMTIFGFYWRWGLNPQL